MSKVKYMALVLVVLFVSSGCASVGDLGRGQEEIEQVLAAWETDRMPEAVNTLEDILDRYQGIDKRFDRVMLTTLALYSLELGNRDSFQHAVRRLREHTEPGDRLKRETQYVLLLDARFRRDKGDQFARYGDSRLRHAFDDLLGE